MNPNGLRLSGLRFCGNRVSPCATEHGQTKRSHTVANDLAGPSMQYISQEKLVFKGLLCMWRYSFVVTMPSSEQYDFSLLTIAVSGGNLPKPAAPARAILKLTNPSSSARLFTVKVSDPFQLSIAPSCGEIGPGDSAQSKTIGKHSNFDPAE